MRAAVSMCISWAFLTSFMCIHDIYLAHSCNRCAGGSDVAGVQGSQPGGGARGVGSRRSNRRRGVAQVPWPPSFLFPKRQAPEHIKSPMFLQIHWVPFIRWWCIKYRNWLEPIVALYIHPCPDIALESYLSSGWVKCLAMLSAVEVRWFPVTCEL